MAVSDYRNNLNQWHLELAMLNDLVQHILGEIEGEDWMTSGAFLCRQKFAAMVESCPFPPRENDLDS